MYNRLFHEIIHSSIWDEDNETRLVWVTMLAMADAGGVVRSSLPGLAHAARVPIAQTAESIRRFTAPDPYSRSKDFEGRRIEECDGGFRILNFQKYHSIRNEDERRQKDAERQRRHRAAQKDAENPPETETVTECHASHKMSAESRHQTRRDETRRDPPTPLASHDARGGSGYETKRGGEDELEENGNENGNGKHPLSQDENRIVEVYLAATGRPSERRLAETILAPGAIATGYPVPDICSWLDEHCRPDWGPALALTSLQRAASRSGPPAPVHYHHAGDDPNATTPPKNT